MAPADPENRCRRLQTVAIRSTIDMQWALYRVSKGASGAPERNRIGQRPYLNAQVVDMTDTEKRAVNDEPGATVAGSCRNASAGAVIGSKQMTSVIAGA
jgi:hypothetical protein